MMRALSGVRVADLALDLRHQALVQRERRLQQVLELDLRSEAGQLLEQLVRVLADVLVCRHQAEIGVDARGDLVIVAGRQVHVAAQLALFAAHDQQHFGVGLVADHAIHDLHAGFLQAIGELDVGFLVEACTQLDDDGDVLAGARGVDQQADQRRIVAGAVQRLFDCQHVRVGAGLLDQFDDDAERFERVVQQDVALGDRFEQAALADDRRVQSRRVFRNSVGTVDRT
jgi:hypothetical protein